MRNKFERQGYRVVTPAGRGSANKASWQQPATKHARLVGVRGPGFPNERIAPHGRTAELIGTAHVVSSEQKAVLRLMRNLERFNGVVIAMLGGPMPNF